MSTFTHEKNVLNSRDIFRDVLILGGMKVQKRFKTLQNIINDLIRSGPVVDHEIQSNCYKQLISNIIGNIPCFNLAPDSNANLEETGEAALDLIVDKKTQDGERLVVVIQRVTQWAQFTIIVGVLVIQTKGNNRWYSLDQSVIEETSGKMKYFQRRTSRLLYF